MTITSKQRAKLKSIASTEETIFQIGKNALSDELIKIKVLENCDYSAKEISGEIAERTESMVVQVIGTKIVLYRQNKNPKKRKIDLND